MEQSITVNGKYCHQESRHVSTHWEQVCADHEDEFPEIRQCSPGTFNVLITDTLAYVPPGEAEYRSRATERGRSVKRYEDGNHLSPRAKMIEINKKPVEAWLYRGGHRSRPVLELVSRCRLVEHFSVRDGDALTLRLIEVPEGTAGMPSRPPSSPGKTIH
jgi:hypothetical protein